MAAKPKSQWTRSSFRDIRKSDTFVNNTCENFNNAINKYIDMEIVTMIKSIQNSCMHKIQYKKTRMEKINTKYCPNAMTVLNQYVIANDQNSVKLFEF